jgi:hypothetical protein
MEELGWGPVQGLWLQSGPTVSPDVTMSAYDLPCVRSASLDRRYVIHYTRIQLRVLRNVEVAAAEWRNTICSR